LLVTGRRVLAVALAGALLGSPARGADSGALAAARRALQDGVSRADAHAILEARAAFLALQVDDASSAALPYWMALCCWRAEPLLYGQDKDGARRLCREGIAACDRAFQADPQFGEALALKASLQGLSLSFVPSAAASLAPEMDESFARARQLDPRNPRIELLTAIFTLHKPARFGGGPARAKPQFERALALFAASGAAGHQGIDWGRDDAWLWSGQCLARLDDWAGARQDFREALAVNPSNRWVKSVLLPDAEAHLAAPRDSQ
jgi:tetratricopeptide (TPR) repeat protein